MKEKTRVVVNGVNATFSVTFSMVPKAIVSELVSLVIFSRIVIEQETFLDYLEKYDGPHPDISDSVKVIGFSCHSDMATLVNVMAQNMPMKFWHKMDSIDVLK